jgi:hypothetical protein
MNLGKIPSVPKIPTAPTATPTHVGQDVGRGPAQGNVGIGAPQHFDPNKPTVAVDATIHNPTGVGGDLHVKKDVPIPTKIPDVNLPSMGSGKGDSNPLSKSGGGFGLPDMPNLGLPSMPNISAPDLPSFGMPGIPSIGLPDMPSMPDMSLPSFGGSGGGGGGIGMPGMPSFGLPDMPSIGLPGMPSMPGMPSLGMPGMPSIGLPGLPSLGMPDIGLPGMPGFRFPDLPKFELPSLDLSEWDLSMPDLIPDWDGDSEEERQEPHKRAKHQDKLKVEISLETENGIPIPNVIYEIEDSKGNKHKGTLDKNGKASKEIVKGEYEVSYPELYELRCSASAAKINNAITTQDISSLLFIIEMDSHTLKAIKSKYDLNYCQANTQSMADDVIKVTKLLNQSTVFEIKFEECNIHFFK